MSLKKSFSHTEVKLSSLAPMIQLSWLSVIWRINIVFVCTCRAATRPVLILLPVLGLTWLCGVLVHLSVVVAYLFITLNAFQVTHDTYTMVGWLFTFIFNYDFRYQWLWNSVVTWTWTVVLSCITYPFCYSGALL